MAGGHPKVDRLRHLGGLRIIEVGLRNRDALPRELERIYGDFLEKRV
jgi:hypothetical protein